MTLFIQKILITVVFLNEKIKSVGGNGAVFVIFYVSSHYNIIIVAAPAVVAPAIKIKSAVGGYAASVESVLSV